MQLGFDFYDGKYKEASYTLISETLFGSFGKIIDNAADAQKDYED